MALVNVRIWGSLRGAANGQAEVEVEARTVGEVLARLRERYPGLKAQIDRGVAVSVDGVVHNRSWLAPIKPGAEVVLLPRIEGG